MDEAFVDQLTDQLGNGRHTEVHSLAQVGDAGIAAEDVLADDLLFEDRIFIAFRGLFQERTGHVGIFFFGYIFFRFVKVKIIHEQAKQNKENAIIRKL